LLEMFSEDYCDLLPPPSFSEPLTLTGNQWSICPQAFKRRF